MNFWDTTNSGVGKYIKIYNKEKFVMIKGFHPAKKDQILFPNPTQSLRKSSASKKYGQSSWPSLCTEKSVAVLEHGPKKGEVILEILLTASILSFCSFIYLPKLCFYGFYCHSKFTLPAEGKHQMPFSTQDMSNLLIIILWMGWIL